MISLDNTTIIFGAIVLLLALITPWINIFVRRPRVEGNELQGDENSEAGDETEEGNGARETLPPISIIITPHENARNWKRTFRYYSNRIIRPTSR